MDLPPHHYVATPPAWETCLANLKEHSQLAIDLEANSLYAYYERVCLIQISVTGHDYIIDPTRAIQLDELGRLIEDPSVEKTFHAAEYDLLLIKREYGWQLENLFDTMWAARILGYERCGLASLLEAKFGFKHNKKYQKANWCRRPLSPPQLAYAQMDTHFLPRLRDELAAELREAGRMAEAQEIFAEQARVEPSPQNFDPDSFWSITGVYDLSHRQQATARALHIYRDAQAKGQNRPAFKIFDDRTLLELAQEQPSDINQLPGIHGMSKGQIRRYGRQLIRLIQASEEDPLPSKPKRNSRRPPDDVASRYESLRTWRKERAQRRGVESDVIVSRNTLWELAWQNPRTMADLANIDGLGPWRRQTYGRELLQVIQKA